MKTLFSFQYAFKGIRYCYKMELNFRIHFFVTVFTVLLSIYFSISKIEWVLIITCSMLVIMIEMINTAIEKICDHITADFHPTIKIIKDISAGAVLVSAIGSLVIGCIIFIPKILFK